MDVPARADEPLVQGQRPLRSLDDVSLQHRPLLEAIEAGEEDKAARLLEEHSEEAGELIAQVVATTDRPATKVVDR